MKYLVLGCNGMAGHIVSLYLKEQGHNVTGFARSKITDVETIIGDATNFEHIKNILANNQYDAVINCIGILNQFAEEYKDLAILLNSYLPHFLVKCTKDTNTQIVHISTDCVFSGKKGSYKDSDTPDGESFYDRTKALGEINNNKDITLRQSIIGPDIKKSGIGLMNWFMQQNGKIKGFDKAIWTGQTTLQLGKTIEFVSTNHISGLYNMVPENSISKYNLLKLFNKYLKNNQIEIEKDTDFVLDKSLIPSEFNYEYSIPSYEEMIADIADWIQKHSAIYDY